MKNLTLILSTFCVLFGANNAFSQFKMEVTESSTKTVNGQVVSSESSHKTVTGGNGNGVKATETSSSFKNGRVSAESKTMDLGMPDLPISASYTEIIIQDRPQKSAAEMEAIRIARAEEKAARAEEKAANAQYKLIKNEQKQKKQAQKEADKLAKEMAKKEEERKRKEEGAWITQKIKGADQFMKDRKSKKAAKEEAKAAAELEQSTIQE